MSRQVPSPFIRQVINAKQGKVALIDGGVIQMSSSVLLLSSQLVPVNRNFPPATPVGDNGHTEIDAPAVLPMTPAQRTIFTEVYQQASASAAFVSTHVADAGHTDVPGPADLQMTSAVFTMVS